MSSEKVLFKKKKKKDNEMNPPMIELLADPKLLSGTMCCNVIYMGFNAC